MISWHYDRHQAAFKLVDHSCIIYLNLGERLQAAKISLVHIVSKVLFAHPQMNHRLNLKGSLAALPHIDTHRGVAQVARGMAETSLLLQSRLFLPCPSFPSTFQAHLMVVCSADHTGPVHRVRQSAWDNFISAGFKLAGSFRLSSHLIRGESRGVYHAAKPAFASCGRVGLLPDAYRRHRPAPRGVPVRHSSIVLSLLEFRRTAQAHFFSSHPRYGLPRIL